MRTTLLALAALLASSSALADTLVTNVNGIQVDANGKLERFTGILIGDDGKVKRLLHGEMLKLRDTDVVDAQGPDGPSRPDRRPWPCHGAGLHRAAARPDRHQLARRSSGSG